MKSFAEKSGKKKKTSTYTNTYTKTYNSADNSFNFSSQDSDFLRSLLHTQGLKAKLKIGASSDPEELEADRVADAVVNGSPKDISISKTSDRISAKSYSGSARELNKDVSSSVLTMDGHGRGLDTTEKDYFESRFNRNFGNVKIHEGTQAADASSAVNARAFTLGNDIFLNSGEYNFSAQSGKKLMAHELAHTMQKNDSTIRRWNGNEHRAFGNVAGNMVIQNFDQLQKPNSTIKTTKSRKKTDLEGKLKKGADAAGKYEHDDSEQTLLLDYQQVFFDDDETYPVYVDKTMEFGRATELSGDHRKTAKDLAVSEIGKGKLDFLNMALLAQTNYNHFFPLASKEWGKNHEIALDSAREAKAASLKNDTKTEKSKTINAMQYEAFALHFLQDSFASGHQYPRALDLVASDETIPGFQAKTFHDLLCALEGGIHVRYERGEGGSRKFHGDGTATSSDYPVALESYNSIAEVLMALYGIGADKQNEFKAKQPKTGMGPDIPKIMKDEKAAPIWYALEKTILAKNTEKKAGDAKYMTEFVKTDTGLVAESLSDVMKEWNAAHISKDSKGNTEIVDPKTLKDSKEGEFILSITKDPAFLQRNQDDNLVAYLEKNKKLPDFLSVNLIVELCKYLLEGACIGSDETWLLRIFNDLKKEEFIKVVDKLGFEKIDKGIDWGNWDWFLALAAFRYPPKNNKGAKKIYYEKNDDASRLLVKWVDKHVFYYNLSPLEWIGVIKALLSGSCGDDDEDAIVKIVDYLTKNGHAKLIDVAVGEEPMDSGVDGAQWNTIVKTMKKYGYSWSYW